MATSLTLADGTEINCADGCVVRPEAEEPKGTEMASRSFVPEGFVSLPRESEAKKALTASRRRIADLPLPPGQLNGISLVVLYSLYGLEDYEIAEALGWDIQQVRRCTSTQAFETLFADIYESVREEIQNDVRGVFTKHSVVVAEEVVKTALDPTTKAGVRLAAQKDVLDRSGHRPADVIHHKHTMEGALKIVVREKRDEGRVAPVIDITPVNATEAMPEPHEIQENHDGSNTSNTMGERVT